MARAPPPEMDGGRLAGGAPVIQAAGRLQPAIFFLKIAMVGGFALRKIFINAKRWCCSARAKAQGCYLGPRAPSGPTIICYALSARQFAVTINRCPMEI